MKKLLRAISNDTAALHLEGGWSALTDILAELGYEVQGTSSFDFDEIQMSTLRALEDIFQTEQESEAEA